jgi:TnsA endonuclease N terminal
MKKVGLYYQGEFQPKNPNKYRSKRYRTRQQIIYRSLWEMKVFKFLDENPNVLWWASEEMFIPYISPHDGKRHRYYPDVIAEFKRQDGTNRIVMIEVKPLNQTMEPKRRNRKTRKYLEEVTMWGVNKAKWDAAKDYCANKNWDFELITEVELGLLDKYGHRRP